MAREALAIAMVVSAFRFLSSKMGEALGVPFLVPMHVALLIPAAMLGARGWCRRISFSRSFPVLACIGLAWIGLALAGERWNHRGLVIVFFLSIALPIGSLIVEQRAWRLCARSYVWANVAAMACVVWFQLLDRGISLSSLLIRLGSIRTVDRSRNMTNPNQVGAQLGMAAVIAFVLYLTSAQRRRLPAESAQGASGNYLVCAIVLSLGCIMTASRGAFAGWFAGMVLLMFWGTRRLATKKIRDFIAFGVVAMGLGLVLAEASDFAPWLRLYERLLGEENQTLGTMAGRTEIWQNAIDVWRSDAKHLVLGVGTGMADEMVAVGDPQAVVDGNGRVRNCHNSLVEWGLSFGLIGLVALAYLMLVCFLRARSFDRRDGSVSRQAILLALVAFAISGTVHRRPDWVAVGALVLAMLSNPPPRRAMTHGFPKIPLPTTAAPRPDRGQTQRPRHAA